MLGFARGSVAPDGEQSPGTSLQAHGWGKEEPLTPQMSSPPSPTRCGDGDPIAAKSTPPRQVGGDGEDGSSCSHPTSPPEGGGLAPSAAALMAAELGPSLALRRSKAGRKPEAAAVSRKPRAAVSRFSGACISGRTAAGAPAPPPGSSQPPASYASRWGLAHSALHLGKAQAWECRSPRREPGMLCYPKGPCTMAAQGLQAYRHHSTNRSLQPPLIYFPWDTQPISPAPGLISVQTSQPRSCRWDSGVQGSSAEPCPRHSPGEGHARPREVRWQRCPLRQHPPLRLPQLPAPAPAKLSSAPREREPVFPVL